jgi:tripartite-type tricarboxylate transporter receptor subunit TctC
VSNTFSRLGLHALALLGLVLGLGLSLGVPQAMAQGAWPNRPLRIIVPLTTGGSNDVLARIIADRLTPVLGQPVLVENRPGAGGIVGTDYVAKQPGDGNTILIATASHAYQQHFVSKLPFDPIKDFEPITLAAVVPFVLTVNADLPVASAKEFVALARTRQKGLTFGTAGVSSPHQLGAEWLRSMTGANFIHVPYKGAAGIVPALVAGEIDFTVGAINSLLPHIRSGKLRALAVAGAKRTPMLPDVPTMAEAVPAPAYGMDVWAGFLAPRGTPKEVIARLNAEINRILRDPQIVTDKLTPLGIDVVTSTPERFADQLKTDIALYEKVIKDANIKAE